jgi:hypothetical protein
MLSTYFKLIRKAISQNRQKGDGGYYESHHIIPKSFNKKSSTVLLTPEEHYRAHKILVECFKHHPIYCHKVYWSFHRMSYDGKRVISEIEYKQARETLMSFWKRKKSETHKKNIGSKHKGKKWIINPITKDIRQIDAKDLQKYLNEGWINSNKSVGQKRSESTKKKISEKAKNRSKEVYKNIGSLGKVVCENLKDGTVHEAASATELAKKLNMHYSFIHDYLNRGIKRREGSKYYEFLNTHKIYYKT